METCQEQLNSNYSTLLLEHEQDFSNPQPIINFIPSHSSQKLKLSICAWNQNSDLLNDTHSKQGNFSPQLQHHKQRIQDFLSTIRIKKGSFYDSSHKIKNKRKSPGSQTNYNETSLVPLNSTLITFPKSRSQYRKLESEQEIILQKLYRKRQKSKVVPKQISISPTVTLKPSYPAKNYLSKNRSFIEKYESSRIQNPQLKTMNEMLSLKRRFASSYYKKCTGIIQSNSRNQTLADLRQKGNLGDKIFFTIDKFQKIKDTISNQGGGSCPTRLNKNSYTSPKCKNTLAKYQKYIATEQIKQQAKNSHLNRKKLQQNIRIQLLGSTITKWKFQAQQKLKPSNLLKE